MGPTMARTDNATAEPKRPGSRLPGMFDRYRPKLEEEIRGAMPQHLSDRSEPPDLNPLLEYHMGWVDSAGESMTAPISQGKALRPTLCLFSCEATGEAWDQALAAAVAIEYVHNFSLIHDDIQDEDRERRHRPTVWSIWGKPRALVAGDGMLALADATMLVLYERGVPGPAALDASAVLMKGYLEMIQGQCLDLSFEGNAHTSVEDYLGMVALKTGALIRCSMAIGALLGSTDPATIEAFTRCGAWLGQAFQVRDDMLGIWGEGTSTGKAVGGDIRRRKKSFPLAFALERTDGPSLDTLTDIFSKDEVDEEDVDQVLGILDEVGAQAYAHEFTCESASRALDQLKRVELPLWAMAEAGELVDFLSSREF